MCNNGSAPAMTVHIRRMRVYVEYFDRKLNNDKDGYGWIYVHCCFKSKWQITLLMNIESAYANMMRVHDIHIFFMQNVTFYIHYRKHYQLDVVGTCEKCGVINDTNILPKHSSHEQNRRNLNNDWPSRRKKRIQLMKRRSRRQTIV